MSKEKLSKDMWVAAGFKALAERGPSALQINLLARELGTTKGSFYWHFKDLADYKAAMLQLWRVKVAAEVIEEVSAQQTPKDRLDALFENARRPAPDDYGGQKIEPAMRAWALSDPDVSAALQKLDELRLSFLETLLKELGLDAKPLAGVLYAAYIGLDDLQSRGRADIGQSLAVLRDMVISAQKTP